MFPGSGGPFKFWLSRLPVRTSLKMELEGPLFANKRRRVLIVADATEPTVLTPLRAWPQFWLDR